MKIKEALSFDDVLLVPRYSDVRSRRDEKVDISIKLKNIKMALPVIASPMDTVISDDMLFALAMKGTFGVIHRYNSIEEQKLIVARQFVRLGGIYDLLNPLEYTIAAAIGVTGDYLERATELTKVGANLLCVDIAHGHHILMKEALENLKKYIPNHVHIMAGNVTTIKAVNDLSDWGADSIRINIGAGSICSTRLETGHGVPGFHAIRECSKTDRDVALIVDGGMRTTGDIVKALAAGADAVMCGSLFAGTEESPGDVLIDSHGNKRKVYRGMASPEAQKDWRGDTRSLEGISSTVPYKGSVKNILDKIEQGIRSGLSYSGVFNIPDLQLHAEWIKQTSAGQLESSTHIEKL